MVRHEAVGFPLACGEGLASRLLRGDWFGDVYERHNGNRAYPKDFLSYNCIYPSCAGFSFFYDVAKNVLYASWSSN